MNDLNLNVNSSELMYSFFTFTDFAAIHLQLAWSNRYGCDCRGRNSERRDANMCHSKERGKHRGRNIFYTFYLFFFFGNVWLALLGATKIFIYDISMSSERYRRKNSYIENINNEWERQINNLHHPVNKHVLLLIFFLSLSYSFLASSL